MQGRNWKFSLRDSTLKLCLRFFILSFSTRRFVSSVLSFFSYSCIYMYVYTLLVLFLVCERCDFECAVETVGAGNTGCSVHTTLGHKSIRRHAQSSPSSFILSIRVSSIPLYLFSVGFYICIYIYPYIYTQTSTEPPCQILKLPGIYYIYKASYILPTLFTTHRFTLSFQRIYF